MTRSATALAGAALVVVASGIATSATGCAPVTTFDMLVTSDRDLFSACTTALVAAVCGDRGDDAAKAACLQSRSAVFGRLHTPRMRRSWLIANGCPEATVDAPPRAAGVVVAAATPTSRPAEGQAAKPAPPVSPPVEPPAPEPGPAPAVPAIAVAATPEPRVAPSPTRSTAAPVRGFSDRDRADTREQRLRDIIVAHGAEMKSCVDRQLKLLPTLRAEGTLIIEVDASGAVPRAELQGADLGGTQLETCLQTVASRWRFPSSGRAYRIDAPVRVWGSELGR